MKPILMMMLSHCPHCRRAREMIAELYEAHPEYRDIPFTMVDEAEDPAFAETLDYYYVPTFFVDGQKLHEGVPTLEAIENVFKTAYES